MASPQFYTMTRQIPGSMWTPGMFFKILGPVPEHLAEYVRPVSTLPIAQDDPSIVFVDGLAHKREAEAFAAQLREQQRPQPTLRLKDLKKRFGWTDDEQATAALATFNMPKGRIVAEGYGVVIVEETDRYQVWREQEIAAWEAQVRFVFPNALKAR